MEWLRDYFVTNFVLLCLSLVMVVIANQRFRQHPKISVLSILIVFVAIILSISSRVEDFGTEHGYIVLAKSMGIIGYTLRPACVLLLILMSERFIPKKFLWILFIPLSINLVIYLCAFIPNTEQIIFGYALNENDGLYHFAGGPLRYTSHIISAVYMSLLLYVSFANLKAKHLEHGIAILICALFVVGAVVIEMTDSTGNIELLNLVIVSGTLVYYLFLYMESTQIDTLTGLFNRETYYRDSRKMGESATGVIQYDMNGLKYINDNFGHLEGDKALAAIATLITRSAKRNMYAYRLGGDEFTVIVNSSNEEEIRESIAKFKELLSKTPYHCSIGYAYRGKEKVGFIDLIKTAEAKMYQDKEEFYKNAEFERRKAEKA